MKVRYVGDIDKNGNRSGEFGNLKIGEIYHVIAIIRRSFNRCHYRVAIYEGDEVPDNSFDKSHSIFYLEAESVEIVTTFVPSSWKIFIYENGDITLCPFAWYSHGFWEDFNEKKAWAEETFGENIKQFYASEILSDKMQVKYIGFLDEDGKQIEDNGLNLGNTYEVLGIRINNTRESFYDVLGRIINSTGENVDFNTYVDTKYFEIISTIAPSSWKMLVRKNKGITLAPASAMENEDFWDSFYEGKLWAEEVFREERTLIIREEP